MIVATLGFALIASLAHASPAALEGRLPVAEFQPSGVIVGQVLNADDKRPLSGARIFVEGTDRIVVTNDEGRFRIEGVSGPTANLRVVMLGFRSAKQVAQVGDTPVQFSLSPVAISIEQVVVTGTAGATEKRTLGNAVSRIEAEDIVKREAVTDVGKLLQSRAAGVGVSEQVGLAGGGARILIRGPGSLAFDGNPIVYVDGVRINNIPNNGPTFDQAGGAGAPSAVSRLNDINPNDIESIEIIKGPGGCHTLWNGGRGRSNSDYHKAWAIGRYQGNDWHSRGRELVQRCRGSDPRSFRSAHGRHDRLAQLRCGGSRGWPARSS